MVRALILITFSLSVISCNTNPTISYKNYSSTFLADDYPKSIIDLYKKEDTLFGLTDREIAIKINSESILDELIDNVLREEYREFLPRLSEEYFNSIKSKMTDYYIYDVDYYSESLVIDRVQQRIADSIVQSKYGGAIYYDSLRRIPRPKEAYSKMIIDLINKNEIQITDEYLKSQIISRITNYADKKDIIECDFNLIETWKKN